MTKVDKWLYILCILYNDINLNVDKVLNFFLTITRSISLTRTHSISFVLSLNCTPIYVCTVHAQALEFYAKTYIFFNELYFTVVCFYHITLYISRVSWYLSKKKEEEKKRTTTRIAERVQWCTHCNSFVSYFLVFFPSFSRLKSRSLSNIVYGLVSSFSFSFSILI